MRRVGEDLAEPPTVRNACLLEGARRRIMAASPAASLGRARSAARGGGPCGAADRPERLLAGRREAQLCGTGSGLIWCRAPRTLDASLLLGARRRRASC